MRPTSGSVMWPASLTSHTNLGPSRHTRSVPEPPPWRTLLVASSWTASTSSAASRRSRPASARAVTDQGAEPTQRAVVEVDAVGISGRRRKRRTGEMVLGTTGVVAALLRPGGTRMIGACGRHDHRIQRPDVVGTQEPEGRRGGERDVDQAFVALALDELGVAATGPDRFADAAQPPAETEPASTKSCHAGMIHAGFAPTSCMSAN